MNRGLLAALGAYVAWGFYPIYWKLLVAVPALQIMAHRVVWCAVLMVGGLCLLRGRAWLGPILASRRLQLMLMGSALLIGGNWWLYIWAVNAGHIVETSLGYFINPLVSVGLGVAVLRETLSRVQWLAVTIAGAGVAYLTARFGQLPWIALGLACSFGGYGLLRKLAQVDAMPGLAVESVLLLPVACAILLAAEAAGRGAFLHGGALNDLLLVATGPLTALPLIWFAYGARRIPLSMVGLLQYIAPTLQLLCGVLIFGEPFTRTHLIGFACIWTALALIAVDGLVRSKRPSVRRG